MGCGKSTVGFSLAHELGWHFLDLDKEIESAEGSTIVEIFDARGEEEFRRLETEALARCVRAVQHGKPHIVSLGGGAFLREDNFRLVSENGVSIWLDCPLPTIEKRLAASNHRPLARDPERLRLLFQSRRESYARAEHRIEIASDEADAAVGQILALSLL